MKVTKVTKTHKRDQYDISTPTKNFYVFSGNTALLVHNSPAVICGINPDNDKFFVGTKGVFAQNPKLNYTEEDIDKNHPGDGLNKKLKLALRYLPELGIKNVVQGNSYIDPHVFS